MTTEDEVQCDPTGWKCQQPTRVLQSRTLTWSHNDHQVQIVLKYAPHAM
jgi:hypothetical protein